MKIAIDIKNLALFGSGISNFFTPLLERWVQERPDIQFYLIGPSLEIQSLSESVNCKFVNLLWPSYLPRALRHPFYDNWIFPRAISQLNPDFVFSPYHDVRLPRNTPSVMMIHDTCIGDLPRIYPFKIRWYYQIMLRINLRRAKSVITVSEASKSNILNRYALRLSSVHVIYNTLDKDFLHENIKPNSQQAIRENGLNIFYTGGNEFRKNISRLLDAVSLLLTEGHEPWLWVTGTYNKEWEASFAGKLPKLINRIKFVGRLSLNELRSQYLAADVVAYPSLCEGFGRACLEAMSLGVPVACSNIAVFQEVSGSYAIYFDPLDVKDIASAIVAAASKGKQIERHDPRFDQQLVKQRFINVMDSILAEEFDSNEYKL